MRHNVDLSTYSAKNASRIKPEKVNLGALPPIEKPNPQPIPSPTPASNVPRNRDGVAPPTERFSERSEFRTENRTVDLPLKRRTKRYSFEFYDDQLTQLKRLKMQAEMSGESVSLSEIVRVALDDYLKRQNV
jgi:hypothetical protein